MGQTRMPRRDREDGPARMSFLSAFAFWIFVSFAGWALIAGVVSILTPDQASQIADQDDAKDIKIAPAAGPEQKKPTGN